MYDLPLRAVVTQLQQLVQHLTRENATLVSLLITKGVLTFEEYEAANERTKALQEMLIEAPKKLPSDKELAMTATEEEPTS